MDEEGVEDAFGLFLAGGGEARVAALAVEKELRQRELVQDVKGPENVGCLHMTTKSLGDVVVDGGEHLGRVWATLGGGEEREKNVVAEESVVGEVGFGGGENGGERDDGVHYGAMRGNKLRDRLFARRVDRTIIGHETVASTRECGTKRRTQRHQTPCCFGKWR